MTARPPFTKIHRNLVTRDGASGGVRAIPEETAIAFTYGSATFAVMMATPEHIEDFAIGFSLTEGIIERASEITSLAVLLLDQGVEARMTLANARDEQLLSRRRRLAGPAGCGLCGIESLEAAIRPARQVVSDLRIEADTIFSAISSLREHQRLNAVTKAVHAAGFWSAAESKFTFVREDVGRHNALDKVCGALARDGRMPSAGFIVVTSRASYEMVQKAATSGVELLAAVSRPTGLAIRFAQAADLTLVGLLRGRTANVYTHPERIMTATPS
jgi:FdhD protein